MPSLSVGIVGLPNVGKSTLFNALLKRQTALVANYPFATIEPNIGIVAVPDERIELLCQYVRNDNPRTDKQIPEKVVPSMIKFYDIAGLVKGASQGEGLGNEFLGHIRDVSVIAHVVRGFKDENIIRAGSVEPESDAQIVNTELILSDLQVLDKFMGRVEKDAKVGKSAELTLKLEVGKRVKESLEKGLMANQISLDEDEKEAIKEFNLLTLKPMIYVLNVSEEELKDKSVQKTSINSSDALVICAKVESELSEFDELEKKNYLKELGIEQAGLDLLIRRCYDTLGLQSYFTMGPKEVHSWTIKKGWRAPQAAGEIHTDFERGFISAEIVGFEDLKSVESLKKAKEKGFVRLEGKNYSMKDGDIVEFNFSV